MVNYCLGSKIPCPATNLQSLTCFCAIMERNLVENLHFGILDPTDSSVSLFP